MIESDANERESGEKAEPQLSKQSIEAQDLQALQLLAEEMAHAFNNTLGAIMGNAEVAAMDLTPNHPAMPALDEVLQASRRARELIRGILLVTRRQASAQTPLQLEESIKESLILLKASLPAGIALIQETSSVLPPVIADAGQIHQLVLYLGINASKAMKGKAGGLTVRLSRQDISQGIEANRLRLPIGVYVRLTVSDTGLSRSPQETSRHLKPVPAGHASQLTSNASLWAARRIVQAHGGDLDIEHVENQGTSFHAYFPAITERHT